MRGSIFFALALAAFQAPSPEKLATIVGKVIDSSNNFPVGDRSPTNGQSGGGPGAYQAQPGGPKGGSTISGRVIDVDTRQPLRGLTVMPYRYYNIDGGSELLAAGGSATTDKEGRYKLERLTPGVYYLEVRPPFEAKIGEAKPVQDFLHHVRRTYARTWYPGVVRLEEAIPTTVLEELDGVDFQIEQRRTAAVRGRILGDAGSSRTGEVSLWLTSTTSRIGARSFITIAMGQMKIGAAFEIDRISPGTYYLQAHAPGRTRADQQYAVLVFDVQEGNLDGLDLYLRKGVTVTGRVRMESWEEYPAESPALPTEDLHVELSPLVRARFEDEAPAPARARDGEFTLDGVIVDRYRVTISSKALMGYQASEVRYNGGLCLHGLVSIHGGAFAHRLEIMLSLAVSSVSATVTDGLRPSPGATVLLVPQPVDDDAITYELRSAKADGAGNATINGLLPGRYRIAAYPEGAFWRDDPSLKQRLVSGQEVIVARHATVQVPAERVP